MTVSLDMWPRDDFERIGDWCKLRETEMLSVTEIPSSHSYIIRVDGRAFHTFTRGMERPFSTPFRNAMKTAAATVLQQMKPQFVYFQSDEITYMWTGKSAAEYEHMFGGKVSKLLSVVASLTSVAFYKACIDEGIDLSTRGLPHFDARLVDMLPSGSTVQSMLQPVMWRENDAMRNSIAMVAQSIFSHTELQGQNLYHQSTMASDAGFDWDSVPPGYLRGTYLTMESVERTLTPEELLRIPENNRPEPGKTFQRSVMVERHFNDWHYVQRLNDLLGVKHVG